MKVIVIGASVAGCATALALARQGHHVRVFERRTSSQSLGAGVVLWPNGTFVLSSLGLLEPLRSLGSTPLAMKRLDEQGSPLGSLDLSYLDEVMGYPTVAILRADLMVVLRRALTRQRVPVAEGHEVVAIHSSDQGRSSQQGHSSQQGAEVRLASGEVVSADLVVGADGRMASVARGYVYPEGAPRDRSAPVYRGVVHWIGTSELDVDLPDPRSILDCWGLGQRFGIVPAGPRRVYWAGAAALADPPLGPTRGEFTTALLDRFAGWPALVTRVVEAAQATAIRRIPVYDIDPQSTWHRNRVLLVGDAAHAALPTSGQGACQALEDAWHLSRCLDLEPHDVTRALATFTATRLDKTRRIVDAGRALSKRLFTLDERARAERDDAARAEDGRRTIAAMASGWSASLPLPGLRSPAALRSPGDGATETIHAPQDDPHRAR